MTKRALSLRRLRLPAAILLASGAVAAANPATSVCVPAGQWVQLNDSTPRPVAGQHYLAELARKRVVLLGEDHDSAEHHRWQLYTISALYALNPDLVLGFEMFPRRAQPALDDWTAGRLTEAELLARTEWGKVWGLDAQLYLPIFHFARMHRVPMLALNVDRSLVRRIGEQGWNAVPAEAREGVSDPAPPSPAYREALYGSWLEHLPPDHPARRRVPSAPDLAAPEFTHFVESMQVWDRAMAQAIAARLQSTGPRLIVALMGAGHVREGHGVPHQLQDLGISDIAALLPWEARQSCDELVSGVADAVFGVDPPAAPAQTQRPRLGVMLDQNDAGVAVREVVRDSIAERAGLKAGDVLTTVAGRNVRESGEVVAAVQRQAPGTWLPLTVRRGDELLELVARFPPAP